ncbi:hypothetical protein ILUMI_23420 [Ignelater luminosus]|uniref:AD domain-containing protein n=1 Tax=Ignelater luminosus TaxID=2038154 RepID=A0A8K0CC27_IGNLU|nr:hypothetical protein ILUMI_23420 [Ignelater luminosus]
MDSAANCCLLLYVRFSHQSMMETNQCFFNDDPQYMKSLIGKSVEVTTTFNNIYKGAVYVIDPETKTLVLATPLLDADSFVVEFVLYHSIRSFEVLSDNIVLPSFLFENEVPDPKEGLESKKGRLKRWLQENLIDVQEEGDELKLGKAFTIEYPYGPEQCLCSNTIILERVRALIEKMPEDFV